MLSTHCNPLLFALTLQVGIIYLGLRYIVQRFIGDEAMSEVDINHELKVLKMMLNLYLDKSVLVTEEGLKSLEVNCDHKEAVIYAEQLL